MHRRHFLRAGVLAGVATVLSGEEQQLHARLPPTPTEIKGPFYPVLAQKDLDFDLTRVEGRPDVAAGTQLHLRGRVLDLDGRPVEDASVELWQANSHGRYRHPHDPNPAPLDPAFQGWAIVAAGKQGGFAFKTILPGPYPAAEGWMRPPHIHFKISKRGYEELVTQMYFPGQQLNDSDRLLQRKTPAEQALMIASEDGQAKDGRPMYTFDIFLRAGS